MWAFKFSYWSFNGTFVCKLKVRSTQKVYHTSVVNSCHQANEVVLEGYCFVILDIAENIISTTYCIEPFVYTGYLTNMYYP
jgi:hypothetical protein